MSRELDLCAIDAGRTGVRYLVWHDSQTLLSGQTDSGVTNILLPGALDILRNIIKSILQRFQEAFGPYHVRVVAIGCTGIAKERQEYGIVLNEFSNAFPGATVRLENDIVMSYIANFQDAPGIILHAGTGSFAFGRDAYGASLRTGGWGYLLGDEGAGFGLGLAGIRAALQALEHTGPETSLQDELLPYFGIGRLDHLKTIVYAPDFQQRIANFTKIVFQHAERRDPVAAKIVDDGAIHMVTLIAPLLQQLDFNDPAIALTGALYLNVNTYYQRCERLLQERYGEDVQVIPGAKSILDGALWLGMSMLEEQP